MTVSSDLSAYASKTNKKPPSNTFMLAIYMYSIHASLLGPFFISLFINSLAGKISFLTKCLSNLFPLQESHLDTEPLERWYKHLLLELGNHQRAE